MQRIKYNTKYDLNQKIDRSLVGANSFADTVAEEFNSAGGVCRFLMLLWCYDISSSTFEDNKRQNICGAAVPVALL